MKSQPYPYQKECVREITRFQGRALLACEMGLGKTLISLWWWKKTPEAHPGLVVCPASVKYVWEHECVKNIGVRPCIVEGRKPWALDAETKIVIVNYDVLRHWLPVLMEFGFQSIFVDEIHYAKNSSSKRSKAVRKLAKKIPHVVGISGTPLLNRPIELFPTLQMLRPDVFQSRFKFANAYCKPRWTPWGWKFDGASRLPDLHRLIEHTCMIRRLKADVLPELPAKIRRVLPLSLSDEGEYRHAVNDFIEWLSEKSPAKVSAARQAETLVKLGYLKRLAARLKLRGVVDWANKWLESYPDEKIVLFAVHRKMIEALQRRVEAESVVVDGSIAGRRRKESVDRFQQDDNVRVLIGNIQAAGVGITLTAASTLAFAELDWVPSNHTQAEDRIHRIGQTRQSWIWYLVAAGTIEEDLCAILEKKQRVVGSILDGGASDDFNVHRQLLSKLQTGTREKERPTSTRKGVQ